MTKKVKNTWTNGKGRTWHNRVSDVSLERCQEWTEPGSLNWLEGELLCALPFMFHFAHFFRVWLTQIVLMDGTARGHLSCSASAEVGGSSGSWQLLLDVWHFQDRHLHRHLQNSLRGAALLTPLTRLIMCKLHHLHYLHFLSIIALSDTLIAIWHSAFLLSFPRCSCFCHDSQLHFIRDVTTHIGRTWLYAKKELYQISIVENHSV